MLHKITLLCLLSTMIVLSPALTSPAAAQGYKIVDLGTLGPPGVGYSQALGISPSGLVTGVSTDGINQSRVFLYSGGAMHSLGFFHYITIGNSINNSGQIAGTVIVDSNNSFIPHGFLFSNGAFTDLGILPGFNQSNASGINAPGQVTVNMINAGRSSSQSRAYLWQNGVFTDLGMLPGFTSSGAYGINDLGQVVGQAIASSGIEHAFLWQSGVMTDLGTLGGTISQATAINNNGQIAGWSLTSTGAEHPVLWQNGGMTDLGVLPGFSYGTAQGINAGGQIVGMVSTSGFPGIQHAFVTSNGVLSDLNTMIYGNPGNTLSTGEGIDSAGDIIANGQINFVYHAYLLSPHTPATRPAAPKGLVATAGTRQVTLTWSPSAEALSYNIKRSTTSGGPYTTVGVARSGPGFTDTSVTSGRTYFYVVTGVNPVGESAKSGQAHATPHCPSPCPPPSPSLVRSLRSQGGETRSEWSLKGRSGTAAGGVDGLPGDPASVIGGQPGDEAGRIFGLPPPAQRFQGANSFALLLGGIAGVGAAGFDGVDGDAARDEMGGEIEDELLKRAFGGDVGQLVSGT
ncbi:MAG TPA: hypothetical protein VKU00_24675 [Chthonomonadaceae bacterium]|nr:hypothetical protein [Chthonomonadaceae bacterium]